MRIYIENKNGLIELEAVLKFHIDKETGNKDDNSYIQIPADDLIKIVNKHLDTIENYCIQIPN